METTSDKHFMNKIEVLENAEKAFADHQFQIYYQPQYNYLNRRIVGTEALVRWIHPQFGIQPPGEFIPVFEDSGLITKLDLYVMEEACRFSGSAGNRVSPTCRFPLTCPGTMSMPAIL